MQKRVALVLAGLALVIAILAMSSVGGAGNVRQQKTAPQPEAWALVNSDENGGGFLRNNGFKSVSYEGDGNYCLTLKKDNNPSARVAIVAPDDSNTSSEPPFFALWQSEPDDCPAGALQVETVDEADGSTNTVAFTILVPAAA